MTEIDKAKWDEARKLLRDTPMKDLTISQLAERMGYEWRFSHGKRRVADFLSLSVSEVKNRYLSGSKIQTLFETVYSAAASLPNGEGLPPLSDAPDVSVEADTQPVVELLTKLGTLSQKEGYPGPANKIDEDGDVEDKRVEKSPVDRLLPLPKESIIGEAVSLNEEEYRYLLRYLEDEIRVKDNLSYYDRRWGSDSETLTHGIFNARRQVILLAAVFFVRYGYSYERNGFWRPFLKALNIPYSQAHCAAFRNQFDCVFRDLSLYRPTGGYRYVSPLIYHSILPNDGITRFAEIIAHEEDMWSYWASADTAEVTGFLQTRSVSRNMSRLLEHDGELVAGLFCDVCDYLATGKSGSEASSGLDVGAVAKAARNILTKRETNHLQKHLSSQRKRWSIPRASWIWEKASSRIGIRIVPIRLATEPGEYVRATIKIGKYEQPLEVNSEKCRTTPVFVDSWHLDMGATSATLELVVNGVCVAKRNLPMLDRGSPIVEINDTLATINESLAVQGRARWLLPEGTRPAEGILQLQKELSPHPLNGWHAGLFELKEGPRWRFVKQGIEDQEYSCPLDMQPSWMLEAAGTETFAEITGFDGPVFTSWPEISLIGEGWGKDFVCEVRNLSNGETAVHALSDISDCRSRATISHKDLVDGFRQTYGCFIVKIKTKSFRSVSSAQTIRYCFLPVKTFSYPRIIWPHQESLDVEINLDDALAGSRFKPFGATKVSSSATKFSASWAPGNEVKIDIATDVPFQLCLRIPRVSWSVDDHPASTCITLGQDDVSDAGKHLLITTDPDQPARLTCGAWEITRTDGVSRWVIPLTTFFEPIHAATGRLATICLDHAGGSWEVLKFSRCLHVTSMVCEQLEGVFYVRAEVSGKTDERFFAIAGLPGCLRQSLQVIELDPKGETGTVINTEGFGSGEWHVVFRFSKEETPKKGELLHNDTGAVAVLKVPVNSQNDLDQDASIAPHPVEEVLCAAEWELPLALFHSRLSQGLKDEIRDGAIDILSNTPEEESRRKMGHIFREGVNLASFPVASGELRYDGIEIEKLASLWQPLAIAACTRKNGEWPAGLERMIGRSTEHPLFLPPGSLIDCDNTRYMVKESKPPWTVEDKKFARFQLANPEENKTRGCLVVGSCDHKGAVLDDDEEDLFEPEADLVLFERIDFPKNEFPRLFGANLVALMRAIWRGELPPPLLPLVFGCANGQHPAFRPEFLLKGYWHWKQTIVGSKDFSQYWQETRQDCAGSFPWLRIHLGEERDGSRGKPVFRDVLSAPCAGVLIELTKQVEQAFPFRKDNGDFAYPGFLFILAVYNRLTGRFPDLVPAIRPGNMGTKWLCEHSAVAFRNARLMLNYWLILVEGVLNWWNETGNHEG